MLCASMARAASVPLGGLTLYGIATSTGSPQAPCTVGTCGEYCGPQCTPSGVDLFQYRLMYGPPSADAVPSPSRAISPIIDLIRLHTFSLTAKVVWVASRFLGRCIPASRT